MNKYIMNSLVFAFALILCIGLTTAETQGISLTQYKEGQRFFLFPDSHGKLHLVDGKETEQLPKFVPETDVNLFLFTRKNPSTAQKITVGDSAGLKASSFDATKPVKFIAHGWTDNGATGEYSRSVREAFLQVLDVNVIVFDWAIGAAGQYPTAVGNVPIAGAFLGKLVDWLVSEGMPVANVHLLGYSLGGHVVGIGGRSVTRGKVPYITGFDPAMPLWGSSSQRLRATDGGYVEVIHTNGGAMGLNEPCGHNDFYPNRGSQQPGCGVLDTGCSHARAWQYFADSLDHTGYQAKQCNSYAEMNNGQCANLSTLYMGGSKTKAAVGIFYLETRSTKPYYLG